MHAREELDGGKGGLLLLITGCLRLDVADRMVSEGKERTPRTT